MQKIYCRSIRDDGYGEGVVPEMEQPKFNYQFPPDGPSDAMLESAYDDFDLRVKRWYDHINSLPVLHLIHPDLHKGKVGWVGECREQYEIGYYPHPDEPMKWVRCTEKEYNDGNNVMADVSIVLVPVEGKAEEREIEEIKAKSLPVRPSLYAMYYQVLKDVAHQHGYNLCIHGSMNRDFDLVAFPWKSDCTKNLFTVANEMRESIGGQFNEGEGKTCDGGAIWYPINIWRNTPFTDEKDQQYYLDLKIYPYPESTFSSSKPTPVTDEAVDVNDPFIKKHLDIIWRKLREAKIDGHIKPMFGSLEAASIEHFLKTGSVNGSFHMRLMEMMDGFRTRVEIDPQAAYRPSDAVEEIERLKGLLNELYMDYAVLGSALGTDINEMWLKYKQKHNL